jgi:hypothetical protein
MLYDVLDAGVFRYGDKYTYSFLFLKVLRQFVKIVRYWGYTAEFLSHETMTESISFKYVKRKQNVIDDIPLKEQYLLFSGLMKIFEDYPDSLVSFCKLNNLRFTELSRDMDPLPFWYAEVVDGFDQSGRVVSIEEVHSAATFLKKRNGNACREHVSRIMGLCLDSRKRADIRKLFTGDRR